MVIRLLHLHFINMDDKYEYPAAITGNSYSISLRNGTYEVKAEASGYNTLSHVIVKRIVLFQEICCLQQIVL